MTHEEACNKFYKVIVKYCYYQTSKNKPDAEDIAGEVFLRLGIKWNTLESHDENRVLGWLYYAANKVILEWYREKHSQDSLAISITANNGVDYEFPDESVDGYEENLKFENYISQIKAHLNDDERELFELVAVKKMPYKKIGLKLHISEAAVKMRLLRLRTKLKPIVAQFFNGEL